MLINCAWLIDLLIRLLDSPQQIEPAFPEILGHKSAASLATGPVIPDPFISPLLLTMTAALSTAVSQQWARPYQVLTLEVDIVTLSSAERLPLADDDGLQDFLSQLGLTLLDTGKEHITHWTGWHTVQSSTTATDCDHVQVLSSSVICAVHNCGDWQTVWNFHLDTVASSSA